MLIENGFNPRDVVRDLTLLNWNENTIKKRLEQLKEYNVRRPKPWMLKCSSEAFQRFSSTLFRCVYTHRSLWLGVYELLDARTVN